MAEDALRASWRYTTASLLMFAGIVIAIMGRILFDSWRGFTAGILIFLIGLIVNPPRLTYPIKKRW